MTKLEGVTRFAAIRFYKRAIELDPDFAYAWGRLAPMYSNIGQRQLAYEAIRRANDLKDRASGREKLYITIRYHMMVTQDLDKAIDAAKLFVALYGTALGYNPLANSYNALGQIEKAIEASRMAIQLVPSKLEYDNLVGRLISLHRLDEADAAAREMKSSGITVSGTNLLLLAALRGDEAAMQQLVDTRTDYFGPYWRAQRAVFSGQLKGAQMLYRQASDMARQSGSPDVSATYLRLSAATHAAVGDCSGARAALSSASGDLYGSDFWYVASSLALCGSLNEAQSVAERNRAERPQGTVANRIRYPIQTALIEVQRGNHQKALDLTDPVVAGYERALPFPLWYVRGRAHLGLGNGKAAAAEFQKIIDHRGLGVFSVYYPLAHLYLGRAQKIAGDLSASRKAYEIFLFKYWKDADPDIPILKEAKAEYAALR